MDFKVCGLIDIIFIVGFFIAFILGYKKGFLKRILSIIGIFAIIIFAFMYCAQLSQFLIEKGIIAPRINAHFIESINEGIQKNNIGDNPETIDILTKALSIPKWLASVIVKWIGSNDGSESVKLVADELTRLSMNVISFFIIVFGVLLIEILLKIIATILRNSKIIRFIDGSLGAILVCSLYMVIVCVIFLILNKLSSQEWMNEFLTKDLQLDNDNFRLCKYIYNGNVLKQIFDLI